MDALVRLMGTWMKGNVVDPTLPSPHHTWAQAHLHGGMHLGLTREEQQDELWEGGCVCSCPVLM